MDIKNHWESEGYCIFRAVYDQSAVNRLRLISDGCLEKWRMSNPEEGKENGNEASTVMRHLNHPGYHEEKMENQAYLLDAVAEPIILEKAAELLGDDPLFRTTSYFFNPITGGGDGNWHRDSQFNTAEDEAEQKLIQARIKSGSGIQMQIALAASDDVEFVPRSHLRWDSSEEYRIRKSDDQVHNTSNQMPGAIRIALDPGDAVVFNPMGLHRGRYHIERIRRTLMWTYSKKTMAHQDYFTDQPWCLADNYLQDVKQGTANFFEDFINEYQTFWLSGLRE